MSVMNYQNAGRKPKGLVNCHEGLVAAWAGGQGDQMQTVENRLGELLKSALDVPPHCFGKITVCLRAAETGSNSLAMCCQLSNTGAAQKSLQGKELMKMDACSPLGISFSSTPRSNCQCWWIKNVKRLLSLGDASFQEFKGERSGALSRGLVSNRDNKWRWSKLVLSGLTLSSLTFIFFP